MKRPAVVLYAALCAAAPAIAAPLDEGRQAYEKGEYAQAHERFLAAARQGDSAAQEYLGFMYAVGPEVFPGVHQDLSAAAQWFGRAAKSGQASALYPYCALLRRGTLHSGDALPCFESRDPR